MTKLTKLHFNSGPSNDQLTLDALRSIGSQKPFPLLAILAFSTMLLSRSRYMATKQSVSDAVHSVLMGRISILMQFSTGKFRGHWPSTDKVRDVVLSPPPPPVFPDSDKPGPFSVNVIELVSTQ